MRIEVDKMCDSFLKVFETMMHECIHVYLYKANYSDFDQHNEKFNRIKRRICEMYNFDVEEF